MPTRHGRAICALVILFALVAVPAAPSRPRALTRAIETYAITNARIFPVSGPVIERGTVVIRDGLITAVGAGVPAPADARVIDGTGLNVYPGLIDASTTLPVPQSAPSAGGSSVVPAAAATPTPSLAAAAFSTSTAAPGLRPETLASDLVQTGGAQIEAARNAGLTAALVAPRDGVLMGQSAFVNLAGETSRQMIVRSPVALHVGFTPLRSGVYPASLMGVFSALRQMLLDAARLREANQIYARS
ncbi:MAG TPA: hypothetical protein VJ715_13780, partial [Pyrinomonadaceae bacterium]|nr:hypothetical protein [Pyrinomonadaceae bacterium]